MLSKIGAIFDWDGVILDSSKCHEKSWELLAAEEGLPLPPGHFKQGFGRKNEVIIPEILKWTTDKQNIHRLGSRKEELYRKICVDYKIAPLPGVKVFLSRLQAEGVLCVVGSSTHRKNIDEALSILNLPEVFQDIISSEDVIHGKPHPEVFLKAAERLGLSPSRCVVFEDAFAGIEAARAGGMKVIAVASTHPAEKLIKADRVVNRLDEVAVTDMAKLLAK